MNSIDSISDYKCFRKIFYIDYGMLYLWNLGVGVLMLCTDQRTRTRTIQQTLVLEEDG